MSEVLEKKYKNVQQFNADGASMLADGWTLALKTESSAFEGTGGCFLIIAGLFGFGIIAALLSLLVTPIGGFILFIGLVIAMFATSPKRIHATWTRRPGRLRPATRSIGPRRRARTTSAPAPSDPAPSAQGHLPVVSPREAARGSPALIRLEVSRADLTSDGRVICPSCGRANSLPRGIYRQAYDCNCDAVLAFEG